MAQDNKNLMGRIQSNLSWIVFVLIVTTISGFFTILGGIEKAFVLYRETLGRNGASEKIINSLAAGESINYFKEKLGVELLKKQLPEDLEEHVFRGDNYFIQAVSDKTGYVVFWSITSCKKGARLHIMQPYLNEMNNKLNHREGLNKIILQKSTFNDVFSYRSDWYPTLNYFLSGATSNSYAYEESYLANAGGYQTIYIGVNDACPSISNLYDLTEELIEKNNMGIKNKTLDNFLYNKDIMSFRQKTKINTYAETAPFGGDLVKPLLDDWDLRLGVDRIDIRILR